MLYTACLFYSRELVNRAHVRALCAEHPYNPTCNVDYLWTCVLMSGPPRVGCGYRFPSGSQVRRESRGRRPHRETKRATFRLTARSSQSNSDRGSRESGNVWLWTWKRWGRDTGDSGCIAVPASCFPRSLFPTSSIQQGRRKPASRQETARKPERRWRDRDSDEKVFLTPDRLGRKESRWTLQDEKEWWYRREDTWISRKMYGSSKPHEATEQNACSKPSHHPCLPLTCFMHSVLVKRSDSKVPFSCKREMHCLAPFYYDPRREPNGPSSRSWMANSPVVHLYSALREKLFKRTEHSRELMDPRNDSFCIQRRLDSCIANVWKSWLGFMKTAELFWDQFLFKPQSRYEIKILVDGF